MRDTALFIAETHLSLRRPAALPTGSRGPLRFLGRHMLLAWSVSLWFVACTAPLDPPSRFEGDYPGMLRRPEVLAHELLWRQRVTASWRDANGDSGSRSFEAVVQKQGPLLTLIGLSPLGSVGFVILLKGEDVELSNKTGQPLPFPPRFVLLDFQRVFFPWVSDGAAVMPDGEHSAELGGEQVIEIWSSGRLMERRFRRLDDQPEGELVVHYTWAEDNWIAPTRALLENDWFNYQLLVETLEETPLEGSE